MAGAVVAEHYGEERRESQVRAERLVLGELRKTGWTEARLESSPKGHRVKVRLALRLRAETTVTYEWIARRWEWVAGQMCPIWCRRGVNVESENRHLFSTPFLFFFG